jgi:hypothetical protein
MARRVGAGPGVVVGRGADEPAHVRAFLGCTTLAARLIQLDGDTYAEVAERTRQLVEAGTRPASVLHHALGKVLVRAAG